MGVNRGVYKGGLAMDADPPPGRMKTMVPMGD